MSLLKTIKSGQNNRKTIVYPGTDKTIDLRILSCQDQSDASLAADRLYKERDNTISFHNVNDYNIEKTVQQLFRACVITGTNTPIADNITEFKALLTDRERDILVDEYNSLNEECNPSPYELSDEEFDKIVNDLKKKPEMTIGNIGSLFTLRKLCNYLACQLTNLQKDSGSTSL